MPSEISISNNKHTPSLSASRQQVEMKTGKKHTHINHYFFILFNQNMSCCFFFVTLMLSFCFGSRRFCYIFELLLPSVSVMHYRIRHKIVVHHFWFFFFCLERIEFGVLLLHLMEMRVINCWQQLTRTVC